MPNKRKTVRNPVRINHELNEQPENAPQIAAVASAQQIQEALHPALGLKIPIRRREI